MTNGVDKNSQPLHNSITVNKQRCQKMNAYSKTEKARSSFEAKFVVLHLMKHEKVVLTDEQTDDLMINACIIPSEDVFAGIDAKGNKVLFGYDREDGLSFICDERVMWVVSKVVAKDGSSTVYYDGIKQESFDKMFHR